MPHDEDPMDSEHTIDADLDRPATRRDLRALEARFSRVDERFVGIDERFVRIDERFMQVDERFDRIDERFKETEDLILGVEARLKRHFDIVTEEFRGQFANLFDWVRATTTTLGERLDSRESGHGQRLDNAEARLTAIELRKHLRKKR